MVYPSLGEVMAVIMEKTSSSEFSPTMASHQGNIMRQVMEGLFAHFFSSFRTSYHHEDVLWFLRLANEQRRRCFKLSCEENGQEGKTSFDTKVCVTIYYFSKILIYDSTLTGTL